MPHEEKKKVAEYELYMRQIMSLVRQGLLSVETVGHSKNKIWTKVVILSLAFRRNTCF